MTAEQPPTSPGPAPWPSGALKLSIGFVLAALLALSAAAWALTYRQAAGGDMVPSLPHLLGGAGHMEGMEMSAMTAPLFIGMWVVMMVAMMFPSVAPMVVFYDRFARHRKQPRATTALFAGSYLLVWSAIGIAAYVAYRAILAAAPSLSLRPAAVAAGAVLAAAGAYQLTRYKSVCLRHCRTPLEFMLRWKPGAAGAARMGGEHGLFCLGCCWGLMAVLFVLGLMNLAWMGVIAAIIFVEKIAPFGEAMARGVGAGLILLGASMALWPGLLMTRLFGG